MADQEEITYGRQLIRDAVRASGKDNPFVQKLVVPLLEDATWQQFTNGQNAFVACFCQSAKEPFLWQKFGYGGAGWVLRFRTNPEMRSTLVPKNFAYPWSSTGIVFRRVIYQREKQVEWIGRLIESLSEDFEEVPADLIRTFDIYLRQSLTEFMVAFKPPSYSDEQEIRLLYWNPPQEITTGHRGRYVSVPFRDKPGSWIEPVVGMELPVIDPSRANISWEDRQFLRSQFPGSNKRFEPIHSSWA